MERLTFEGNFCDIAQCESVPGGSFCESGSCSQRKVWERLKEYEYTGLTPEKVASMRKDMAIINAMFQYADVERMQEIAAADREGRVVVLPCKVGDKLYRVFDGNISEHEVQNMKYFARQGWLGIDMTPFFPDVGRLIGKTVFQTREEAEGALRRAENG